MCESYISTSQKYTLELEDLEQAVNLGQILLLRLFCEEQGKQMNSLSQRRQLQV